MRRVGGASFPVGLYGTLLLALCWLAVPAPFRLLERWLLAVAALPGRALAAVTPVPALAADAVAAARVLELGRQLDARLRAHHVHAGQSLLPATWVPVHSRVVAVERIGGGGLPSELRLAHTYAQLAGCQPFVTQGEVLLGRLAVQGHGVAIDDRPDDLARVLLCNHVQAAPVAAGMALPDGGLLRMVVASAARVDRAPLKVQIWDDPYRAAGLRRGGDVVRTLSLPGLATDAAPPDLLLGHSQVWGYGTGDAALTIGMFVEPAVDVRSLSHVVVWTANTPPGEAVAPATAAAQLAAIAGGAGGRGLLSAAATVPDGAAVLVDGVCVGTARGLAFGQALVTSFATSRHRWALLLLPDDAAQRPRELWGDVVSTDGGTAWLRCRGGDRVALSPGFLFTGSNGASCPPGLLLGRAEPIAGQPEVLAVVTPQFPATVAATVVVAEGLP